MVAEKCKGLPLVIKTVGSILRFETNEIKWRDVLQSELWGLEQTQNEVLPVLELSYKHMPIYLKQCFVALSLYPKYYYLDENMVVWLWKLLGLLQGDEIYNRDEIGKLYFNELVQRSMLQSSIHGQKVMHDLVHDLACFLAGEEFFRLEDDKQTEVPRGARYMSIMPIALCKKRIQISNASQSLRAIIMIQDNIDIVNPEVLFLHCKKLRIIYVVQGSVQKALLDFIGGMKLLRHLTLSGYECAAHLSRPNSMSQLFNLQTLNMQAYTLLKIGRLVNLQTLPEIHLMKCGCFVDIRELRNMNKIRKLCIRGLCNVPSITHADEAHLQSKRNLEVLELDFDELFLHKAFDGLRSCEHTEHGDANEAAVTLSRGQLLEKLRPHCQGLKVLRIQNFNHGNYPSWLGSASFSKLTELKLQACQSRYLPTLGELPSLKSLDIRQMECVEHISHEFCSLDPRFKGFQALRDLSFDGMNRLSEWSGVEDGEFPRLETLSFWNAIELKSLPLVPLSCLCNLRLYGCKNLVTFPASATMQELNISTCEKLKELPALPSLRSLQLFHCPSLFALGHFPWLTSLGLYYTFHEDILCKLVNSYLTLEDLTIWSDTIKSIALEPLGLPSLRKLELRCPNLHYCGALTSLSSLKILNITGTENTKFEPWKLPQLVGQCFLFQACQSQHLPTLGELPSLKSVDIRQMEYVEHIGHEFCSLDPRFKGFQALRDLRLDGLNRLLEWSGVEDGEFPRLETLLFWDAFELRSLPLVPFLSLCKFTLIDCSNLVTFPASDTLKVLNISICEKLKELPSLPSLQSLHLFNCPSLVTFGHFPSLTILYLDDPFKQEILHRLVNSHLRMEELTISSNTLKSCCDTLASISSLKKLNISASPLLHLDVLHSTDI
uniref:NB-ARC domain-containing protein n=1 Tax=Oryza punctata TaxID=4537 RepID=A0A0E0MFL4_ORYPU